MADNSQATLQDLGRLVLHLADELEISLLGTEPSPALESAVNEIDDLLGEMFRLPEAEDCTLTFQYQNRTIKGVRRFVSEPRCWESLWTDDEGLIVQRRGEVDPWTYRCVGESSLFFDLSTLEEIPLWAIRLWCNRVDESIPDHNIPDGLRLIGKRLTKNIEEVQGAGQPKTTKRSKPGGELWRKAMKQMIGLLNKNKLPKTIRQAGRLLRADGFKPSTVYTAASRSVSLMSHFGLLEKLDNFPTKAELLDELSGAAARQFEKMPEAQIQALGDVWRDGKKQEAVEMFEMMVSNPNAGSTGDVSLIENIDQDSLQD